VESRIHRVEQQIRWSADKAGSLPSADMWRTVQGHIARSVGCSWSDPRSPRARSPGGSRRPSRRPTQLAPPTCSRR
jgi:hypothetical protein